MSNFTTHSDSGGETQYYFLEGGTSSLKLGHWEINCGHNKGGIIIIHCPYSNEIGSLSGSSGLVQRVLEHTP